MKSKSYKIYSISKDELCNKLGINEDVQNIDVTIKGTVKITVHLDNGE